jgi:hypothetical protein
MVNTAMVDTEATDPRGLYHSGRHLTIIFPPHIRVSECHVCGSVIPNDLIRWSFKTEKHGRLVAVLPVCEECGDTGQQ